MPLQTMADFFQSHLIGSRTTFFGIEATELAKFVTNISVVNMLVADKVGLRSVLTLTNQVSKIAHTSQIRSPVKQDAVFTTQSFALLNFVKNRYEFFADELFWIEWHKRIEDTPNFHNFLKAEQVMKNSTDSITD